MNTQARQIAHYHSATGRPTIEDPRIRRLIWKSFDRTVGRFVPANRKARILDVGCGEGAFLAFLREAGYMHLEGFDLSPECVEISHRVGLDFVRRFDMLRLAEWPGDEYEAIVLLDILEHLPKAEVARVLEVARGKLVPGGVLLIQTPNLGSLLGVYCYHSDLTHEFGLTERSVKDLLVLAGFTRESVDVCPAWNAATAIGRLREAWQKLLHFIVYLAEDAGRPSVPTKNLLVRATRTE